MGKAWPVLRTDEEAERFVAEADLTEHDFSAMVPVRFELRRKDKAVNLRLPVARRGEAHAHAARHPCPCQRLIRQAIEQAMVTESAQPAKGVN